MSEDRPADEIADTGLTNLVSTWTPRSVRVGKEAFEVRPATTREALGVLAAVRRLNEGDLADGWSTLRELAERWLPETLSQRLFWPYADVGETAEAMIALLATGAEDEEAHAEREEEAKERARHFTWPTVVAAHACCYQMGYAEVLEQPWPLFLVMQEETGRMHSREQVRSAEWYAAAKTGQMDSLLERAQVPDTRPQKQTPWESEGITKEEYERRLRSRALRVQKNWRQKEARA